MNARKPFKITTPQYLIRNEKGDHFDVFNKRENGISATIKLATDFPGNKFLLIKKVNMKEKVIFSFLVQCDFDLDDVKDIYNAIISAYQKKLESIQYWRKNDV